MEPAWRVEIDEETTQESSPIASYNDYGGSPYVTLTIYHGVDPVARITHGKIMNWRQDKVDLFVAALNRTEELGTLEEKESEIQRLHVLLAEAAKSAPADDLA